MEQELGIPSMQIQKYMQNKRVHVLPISNTLIQSERSVQDNFDDEDEYILIFINNLWNGNFLLNKKFRSAL